MEGWVDLGVSAPHEGVLVVVVRGVLGALVWDCVAPVTAGQPGPLWGKQT